MSENTTLKLLVIPNYWSKAETVNEAWKAIRGIAGTEHARRARRSGKWVVYDVHPESYCESVFGDIHHPKDHPPVISEYGKAIHPPIEVN